MTKKIILLTIIGLLTLLSYFQFTKVSAAATLTALSDQMSIMEPAVTSSHTILFTTQQSDIFVPASTITVDFNEDGGGYTVAGATSAATDFDFSIGGQEQTVVTAAGCSGANNVGFAVNDSTGVVTFTACSSYTGPAGGAVIIKYGTSATVGGTGTNRVTNPSASATPYQILINAAGETGSIATLIIADDTIGISATVDPTLAFSISDLTVGFGTFAGTAVRYATGDTNGSASGQGNTLPTQLSASTNGDNGVLITIYDEGSGSAAGLWAAAPISELITAYAANTTTITAGSKRYGAYGKNASNLTIDEGFDFDNSSDLAISRSAQTFATSTGPVNNATVDLAFIAAIDATTKAGAYNDTVTVVCTGRY